MKTLKIFLTGFALIAISNTGLAGYYDQDYTYAQVVDVQPIYEEYRIPQNRRVCDDNRGRPHNRPQHASNGGGAILGGIIGGIIGNRFGKGHGRQAATAAGVILGSTIGSNARPQGYYSGNGPRRACYNQREYRLEQRINGYNVSYEYNGRVYQTRMQNHPGDKVRVQINVQVAEY